MTARTAATITDTHIKERRHITTRGITGQLDAIAPVANKVTLTIAVGSKRVLVTVAADEAVEVHAKEEA